jgi:two-component system cell cycle sensor histidine kinase/response regulator CckA
MERHEITVLAVDDQPDNLITIKALLHEAFPSSRALTALDGSSGIALAVAEDPDVILLDIVMPDMDGFEVCRRLKSDERTRDIPVIFLTALRTDRANRVKAVEVGAEAFLSKPIDETELAAQMRAMAKIKTASLHKRDEARRLAALVAERTRELEQSRTDALNLLADLRVENEARRKTEMALRESEEKYRTLFDSAGDAIFIHDVDGRILATNTAACERYGYTQSQLLSMTVAMVDNPAHAAHAPARIARLMEEGALQFETEHRHRDGRVISVDVNARRIAWSGQTATMSICRDITERKRAEAEHRRLEEQFQVSQKMEAIGSLAGGVAHDFNNLLTVILNYTGFAIEKVGKGDPLWELLVEVKKAGERAAALTRQLLAFSRKQVLALQVLDLNQLVANLEKMLRRLIGEDIHLEQRLAPDLGRIKADPGQIEQVIMNLVVNARDAMPDGGKLTIETSNIDLDEEYATRHLAVTPGPHVLLAISDSGCGMDAATLKRLFEPFFTTKAQGKGTGLGLSTVYGIVKQSGGDIQVYSEVGKGTTFKVYLPRMSDDEKPEELKTTGERPAVGHETILLVEDEAALREVVERMLRAMRYKVLKAASGSEALRIGQQYQSEIHLLLTDVVMPQMSGRQLAEQLIGQRPSMRVLYMSGYTDDAIVHHGVLDPGTEFISKPFTSADLARKVRDTLDIDSLTKG